MNKLICLPLWLVLVPGSLCLAEDGDKPGAFRTLAVKRGTVVQTVSATGTLEPEDVIDVGAQVEGRVEKLGTDPKDPNKTIDFGSEVAAGTVLTQLDASLPRTRVDRAKARLQLARANLKLEEAQFALAERERARAEKLLRAKAISQEEFDATAGKCEVGKARVGVEKARVEEAEAALKEAEVVLDYTTIRSPAAGVILDRRVNVGQAVGPGSGAPSLFLIARSLKRMQVWASVPETDIAQVHVGQRATFTVDAYPRAVFEGKVNTVRLNAGTAQGVVVYTVAIDADNARGLLLPYLTAEARFIAGERKDVLLVPNAALRWRPRPEQVAPAFRDEFNRSAGREPDAHDTGIVWVEEKGHVRPVDLRLGLTDGTVTEVVKGDVRDGTLVVVGAPPAAGRGEKAKEPPRDSGAPGSLGADMLLIQPGLPAGKPLTAEEAEAILRGCPSVSGAAPVVRARMQVVFGKSNWVPLYIYGSTPALLKMRGWEDVAEGRPFTKEDVRGRKKVCLVGRTLVRELFGGKWPVGEAVHVGGVRFEVVGVLPRLGDSILRQDQDDVLLVPWTAIKDLASAARAADNGKGADDLSRLYPGPSPGQAERSTGVDQILVRAASAGEAAEAKEQIIALLRQRHRIRKGQPDDFNVRGGDDAGKRR